MSKLLHSRFFRLLVCLILVFAFLVNLSPLNVRAIDPATLYAVKFAAESIIASILIALGFEFCRYGMNEGISLVYDIFDYMANELQPYYFIAGEMGVYTNNGVDFYVLQDAVDDIRAYLFDNSILSSSEVTDGWSLYGTHLLPTFRSISSCPYNFIRYDSVNGNYVVYWSSVPVYAVFNDDGSYRGVRYSAAGTYYYMQYSKVYLDNWTNNSALPSRYGPSEAKLNAFVLGEENVTKPLVWTSHDIFTQDGSTLVFSGSEPISEDIFSCLYDIALGHVASEDESVPVGYPEWADGSVQVPGQISGLDEDLLGLPVALGTTFDETMGFNQEQAWQGLGTYQDQNQDVMDPTEGTIPGYDQEVWVPPANPGQFALDLTSFFPFCIPFDMYDFLTCLNADPVTPVIQWEIAMPGGGSYPLTIDLSPFDSIAQLLRRLELLAFCIGLAIKTRDLIKG